MKSSEKYTNISPKNREEWTLINTHQNSSLHTLPKYNKQSVCDCDQKCCFTTNKGIVSMKCTMDVMKIVMTLRND